MQPERTGLSWLWAGLALLPAVLLGCLVEEFRLAQLPPISRGISLYWSIGAGGLLWAVLGLPWLLPTRRGWPWLFGALAVLLGVPIVALPLEWAEFGSRWLAGLLLGSVPLVALLLGEAPSATGPRSEFMEAPARPSLPLRVLVGVLAFGLPMVCFHLSLHSATGDEPHYLMAAASLWQDGDFNQLNQYQAEEDRQFHWGKLEPKISDIVTPTSVVSQALGLLYPLLLALGYGLGGRLGASLTSLVGIALALAGIAAMCRRWGLPARSVGLATLLAVTAFPMSLFLGQIYPESLGMALTALGVVLLESSSLLTATLGVPVVVLLLALTKTRFYPIFGLLLLFLCLRLWAAHPRKAALFALLCAGGGTSFLAADKLLLGGEFFFHRFGTLHQMSAYFPDAESLWGGLGLFLDQEAGLLSIGPLWLLAAGLAFGGAGLPTASRWRLRGFLAANFVVIAAHPMWHSLPTPQGRYLLVVMPLLIPFLAAACTSRRRVEPLLAVAALGGMLSWGALVKTGWRGNQGIGLGFSWIHLEKLTGAPLSLVVPSLVRLSPHDVLLLAAWCYNAIGAAGAIYLWWRRDRNGILVVCFPAVLLGILALPFAAAHSLVVRELQPETSWVVLARQGHIFPDIPDPYFHDEAQAGWTLLPGESITLRLDSCPEASYPVAVLRSLGQASSAAALEVTYLRQDGDMILNHQVNIEIGGWWPVRLPRIPVAARGGQLRLSNASPTNEPIPASVSVESVRLAVPGREWQLFQPLAEFSAGLGLWKAAAWWYEGALLARPDSPELAGAAFQAFRQSDQWRRAGTAWLVHRFPTPTDFTPKEEVQFALGLLKCGGYVECLEWCAARLAAEPDAPTAHANRLRVVSGYALALAGRYEEAMDQFATVQREGEYADFSLNLLAVHDAFLREELRFLRPLLVNPEIGYLREFHKSGRKPRP